MDEKPISQLWNYKQFREKSTVEILSHIENTLGESGVTAYMGAFRGPDSPVGLPVKQLFNCFIRGRTPSYTFGILEFESALIPLHRNSVQLRRILINQSEHFLGHLEFALEKLQYILRDDALEICTLLLHTLRYKDMEVADLEGVILNIRELVQKSREDV